jgi:hypothetical protein
LRGHWSFIFIILSICLHLRGIQTRDQSLSHPGHCSGSGTHHPKFRQKSCLPSLYYSRPTSSIRLKRFLSIICVNTLVVISIGRVCCLISSRNKWPKSHQVGFVSLFWSLFVFGWRLEVGTWKLEVKEFELVMWESLFKARAFGA